ncbi:MAG: enoyl-CoA hydratase/isomerase family protein [Lysinibacillus sp.]
MEDVILFEKDENIAILTFNQPEKLNVVNVILRDLLYEYILAIKADPTIHAVVITGKGRGFCAGADLSEFGTTPSVIEKRRIRIQHDIWEELRTIQKPIAVAMHGFAIGSGIEMAMICDFRFAAPRTKLSLPEASLGTLPAAGGTQSLPRLMRHGHAMSFILKGNMILAEKGVELGIITEIFPQEELLNEAIAFMKNITRYPKTANLIKRLVANHQDQPLEKGLAVEQVLVNNIWQERLLQAH